MKRLELSVSDLDQYVPAHIIVAADDEILAVGPAIERRLRHKWRNQKLSDVFAISRGFDALSADDERRASITLESRDGDGSYAGYVWRSDRRRILLLSCTSSVTELCDLPLVPRNIEAILQAELQEILLREMQKIANRALTNRMRADALAESATLFSSLISHDLNNYFSVINMTLERASNPEEVGRLQFVSQAKKAAALATTMMKSLLKVAGSPESHGRSFFLDPFVLEMESFLGSLLPENVQLVSTLAAPGVQVFDDPQYLMRALTNLLKNSGQALTESGGTVFLETRFDDVHLSTVRISVKDTAPPLQPHQLDALQRGLSHSTKLNGHGLGLRSVRAICEKLGWNLILSAHPGSGLCAELVLNVEAFTNKPSGSNY